MNLKEIRVRNALYWDGVFGRAKLAEKLGYDDTNYMNGLLTGKHSFGNAMARNFEKRLNLDMFWMDRPHPVEWGVPDDQMDGFYDLMLKGMSPEQIRNLINVATKKLAGKS